MAKTSKTQAAADQATANANQAAQFTAPEPARQDLSSDDHADSYLQGVGVQHQHPAHDPSKPGKMPYELNTVPSQAT